MKKILGDERGETEKRTDGESGSRDGPRATPRGVLGKPVEKQMSEASTARHGTGSTDSSGDWRERKAGPGSRRQGADREVDGSWMRGRDGEEERRGEERRRSERERVGRGRCPQSQRRSELRQSDDDTQPKLGGRAACRLWWSAIHLALAPVANQWGSHVTSQCAPGQCKHSEQARSTLTQCPTACGAPV